MDNMLVELPLIKRNSMIIGSKCVSEFYKDPVDYNALMQKIDFTQSKLNTLICVTTFVGTKPVTKAYSHLKDEIMNKTDLSKPNPDFAEQVKRISCFQ